MLAQSCRREIGDGVLALQEMDAKLAFVSDFIDEERLHVHSCLSRIEPLVPATSRAYIVGYEYREARVRLSSPLSLHRLRVEGCFPRR